MNNNVSKVSGDAPAGVLRGLACGDALGRPVGFQSEDRITAVHGTLSGIVRNGTWGKPAGMVSDDTDQALCLARNLGDRSEFDSSDVADQFVEWYNSDPFDIGTMTGHSISRLSQGGTWDGARQKVWEASPEGSNAGNGSVMRCPPLAIAYSADFDVLARVSSESSQITHADPRSLYRCVVPNHTIAGYLRGSKRPLNEALDALPPEAPSELFDALESVADGQTPESLSTPGLVVHTLQTVLYVATRADDTESDRHCRQQGWRHGYDQRRHRPPWRGPDSV